jgi:hypothetical protein
MTKCGASSVRWSRPNRRRGEGFQRCAGGASGDGTAFAIQARGLAAKELFDEVIEKHFSVPKDLKLQVVLLAGSKVNDISQVRFLCWLAHREAKATLGL